MRAAIVLLTAWAVLAGCHHEDRPANGPFEGKVVTTYDEAMASAKAENKPVLIVAYKGNADMIDRNLLNDGAMRQSGSKFITAKLDAATQSEALSKLNITTFPALVILKPDGTQAWSSGGTVPYPGQVAVALDGVTGSAGKQ